MIIEKLFYMTKNFERTLEALLKVDNLSKDKKMQIEHNLKIVSDFNKMEIIGNRYEFKH